MDPGWTQSYTAPWPDNVSTRDAAFNAVMSVGMHGLRRAGLSLGESVQIVGLGMIGLISVQYAKLAGLKVMAVEIDPERLEMARAYGADAVLDARDPDYVQKCMDFTNGRGFDGISLTAGSAASGAPIDQAMSVIRDKGKVVMVGNIKIDFDRVAMYNKEADLLIARSYGSGRYDPIYEQDGIDYPIGFVRWTENRNSEEFIYLLSQGKVSVEKMITEVAPFEKAVEIYEKYLVSKKRPLGLIFEY